MTLEQLLSDVRSFASDTISGEGFKGLMLGIVFSLKRATDLGFTARVGASVGPDYSTELDETAVALVSGQELPSSWLAGFFFNSALMRIAAGSHRAFRVLFGTSEGTFWELAHRAVGEGKMRAEEIRSLRSVYDDVNAFKHDGRAELLVRRRVKTLGQAIDAAAELVRLIQKAVSYTDRRDRAVGGLQFEPVGASRFPPRQGSKGREVRVKSR